VFRGELDRVFDRFAGSFSLPSFRRMFDVEPAWRTESSFSFSAPSVDVTEDGKAYKITAELPGMEQKNIDISVSGDMLTLKGEKHYEKDEKDKNHHVSERAYGSFQRSFALPDGVDRDKITADLSKGVLTTTHRSIRRLLEELTQVRPPEAAASTASTLPAFGFVPPHVGPSEDIATH
jgi:HSP20 family protein